MRRCGTIRTSPRLIEDEFGDATLPSACEDERFFTVRGKVTGPNGEPLAGIHVLARETDDDTDYVPWVHSALEQPAIAVTAQDGTFELQLSPSVGADLAANGRRLILSVFERPVSGVSLECLSVGYHGPGGLVEDDRDAYTIEVTGRGVSGVAISVPQDVDWTKPAVYCSVWPGSFELKLGTY